jgi:hypothetical protein
MTIVSYQVNNFHLRSIHFKYKNFKNQTHTWTKYKEMNTGQAALSQTPWNFISINTMPQVENSIPDLICRS